MQSAVLGHVESTKKSSKHGPFLKEADQVFLTLVTKCQKMCRCFIYINLILKSLVRQGLLSLLYRGGNQSLVK